MDDWFEEDNNKPDPILAYLLEFNETNPIKYKGRYIIPIGGLKEMLSNYKKFGLKKEDQ